jgi:hypothetical protein
VLIAITVLGLIEIFFVIRIPFVNADIINALAYTQWDAFKHWALVLVALFVGQLLVGASPEYFMKIAPIAVIDKCINQKKQEWTTEMTEKALPLHA